MAGPAAECPVRVHCCPDAYLARVDEDQLDMPADPTRGSSSVGVVVIGLVIGLAIAGAVILLSRGNDSADTAPPPSAETPTTLASSLDSEDGGQNGDAVDLIVAYGRSRTDDHALTGELIRPDRSPVAVRRAIMGGRALDEVGATAAVTQSGETQQCELIDDQWLCAPPLPEITIERDVQGFASLFLTEEPTYSVFAVSAEPPDSLRTVAELGSVTCWSMVSAGRVDRSRFGEETTMCFHDALGALVGRVTETSGGSDIFLAKELRGTVDVADVEPSR